jgi:hypothetical protein
MWAVLEPAAQQVHHECCSSPEARRTDAAQRFNTIAPHRPHGSGNRRRAIRSLGHGASDRQWTGSPSPAQLAGLDVLTLVSIVYTTEALRVS